MKIKTTFPTILLVVILLTASAFADEYFTRTIDKNIALESGEQFELKILMGRINIEPGSGTDVEMEAKIHSIGSTQSEAKQINNALEFIKVRRSGKIMMKARLDLSKYKTFYYPALKGSWESTTTYDEVQIKITSRPGEGVALWSNVTLRLPIGVKALVDANHSQVALVDLTNSVIVDIGGGEVNVTNHEGNLDIDTGSARTRLDNVMGEVRIDTGSGGAGLSNISGNFSVDSGSGRVEVFGDIRCRKLHIDTGSGGVLIAPDLISCDNISIDTGSGDVKLVPPGNASWTIYFDPGSGRLYLDPVIEDLVTYEREYSRGRGRERYLRLGAGGDVNVNVDTGSGSLRIAHSR